MMVSKALASSSFILLTSIEDKKTGVESVRMPRSLPRVLFLHGHVARHACIPDTLHTMIDTDVGKGTHGLNINMRQPLAVEGFQAHDQWHNSGFADGSSCLFYKG
jgi:hypothetical protein